MKEDFRRYYRPRLLPNNLNLSATRRLYNSSPLLRLSGIPCGCLCTVFSGRFCSHFSGSNQVKMATMLDKWLGIRSLHVNSNNNDDLSSSDSYVNLMLSPWRGSRTSWIVQSESNVRREPRKLPDPPCITCKGSGRTTCKRCNGRGRTNFIELAMLPKGEWPVWCGDCKGSGLDFCGRCLGSGERRGVLGFHVKQEDRSDGQRSDK